MHLDGSTRLTAVLGHPVAHTASPAMHNAAFDALRLNWRYVALDVPPERLRRVLFGLAEAGFAGVNLTVPHKRLVMRWLGRADATAAQFQAANTLVFQRRTGGIQIHGHNTDGYGLVTALREEFGFRPRGRTVAIVGCGGAGQGAAIQLAREGARRLVLLNRTLSKARAVARRIHALGLRAECVFQPEPCGLVIQATSLGLKASDPLPLSGAVLRKLQPDLFYDMIYRPAETPAMRLARRHGVRAANGLGMLLHQGARAFEIWTGRKAPVAVMRRALRREVYGR